jgi:hypothetical protein
MARQRRQTAEQIVNMLRQAANEERTPKVCRSHGGFVESNPPTKCGILDDRDQVLERRADGFSEADQAAAFPFGEPYS